jgi:hypothetical protein
MVQNLENTLVNNMVQAMLPENSSKDAVENAKNALRGHIRETECFQKMSTSGDENIRSALENPEKMSMIVSAVTNSIMDKAGPGPKENINDVPQRNNQRDMEQPQSAPKSLGGFGM